ncbi:hypothetical protein [Sorangium sp. So ce1182]|uniref:hypothetical protein n=1 Tax=Sorangium sp. So ce1182 TaxID=3133334 RepID=UPI003F624E4A
MRLARAGPAEAGPAEAGPAEAEPAARLAAVGLAVAKLPSPIWSDGRRVATTVNLGARPFYGGLASSAVLCDLGP